MSRRGITFLTDKGVKAQREPGKYFDGYGHGLYLRVGTGLSLQPSPKAAMRRF